MINCDYLKRHRFESSAFYSIDTDSKAVLFTGMVELGRRGVDGGSMI